MSTEANETVAAFRTWLGEQIWRDDDMGGFLQPFATPEFEAETTANVAALFDLIDPEWREFTHGAVRDRLSVEGQQ